MTSRPRFAVESKSTEELKFMAPFIQWLSDKGFEFVKDTREGNWVESAKKWVYIDIPSRTWQWGAYVMGNGPRIGDRFYGVKEFKQIWKAFEK